MKRLVWGVVIIALLAGGSGLLAGAGGTQAAIRAATAGRSDAVGRLPAVARPVQATPTLRPTTSPATLAHARAVPSARGGLVAPRATRSATYLAAGKAKHAPVAAVQVVDPASVTLPPTGPLLLLNPNTAAPGATISVLGSGFDAGKLVTLTLVTDVTGSTQALTQSVTQTSARSAITATVAAPVQLAVDTAQAGRDGSFAKTITLPAALGGRTFVVSAQERKGVAHARVRGIIATGSPTATLSTAVGKPGDTVYTSARGFGPNEAIGVFLNNLGTAPVTTLHANRSGQLSLDPIPVPYGPVGPTSLLLLGQTSHGLAAIPFEMLGLYPTASVNSYAAVADTVLSFTASGFGPDEDVIVRVNTPDGFAVGTLRTDSMGTIRNSGHFRIPFSLKGRNTFVLTGAQSHTSTTVAFTVQPYQPIAAPSSYGGGPGTAITFYGSGFARDEMVRVWLNQPGGGRSEVATMRTDSRGNLVARAGLYLIGAGAQAGKRLFTLAGDKSVTPVTVAFTVQTTGGSADSATTAP